MQPVQIPVRNDLGREVSHLVPPASEAPFILGMRAEDADIWELAAPLLRFRNNDGHTLYAYGIARALLTEFPDADPDVVLPGILLHDTGWSTVALEDVLSAIQPGAAKTPENFATVRKHELEGARLASEILETLDRPSRVVEAVAHIIDGHDTRLESLSLEDSLVKDADKVWRLTPHGIETSMNWFGLNREEAHRLTSTRTHEALFTEPARIIAKGLSAVAWVDCDPRRIALG